MALPIMKGAAGLVLGLGLASAPALAQQRGGAPPEPGQGEEGAGQEQQGVQQGQRGRQQGEGTRYQGASQQQGQGMQGRGGQQQGQQQGAENPYGTEQQGGSMIGSLGKGEGAVTAVVPQYWVADASLFIGTAANAAHVLSLEEGLNVQVSPVLASQAQFLLDATTRALTSVQQLEQNAEANNPNAFPELRSTIGQLTAAKAQATQVVEAIRSGSLGPSFNATIRAALGHLAVAEQDLHIVGRTYNMPQFATAGVCSAGKAAFGAGLGRGFGAGLKGQQKPGAKPGGVQHPGAKPGDKTEQPGAKPGDKTEQPGEKPSGEEPTKP